MTRSRILSTMCMICLLFCSLLARGQTVTIDGPYKVCMNSSTSFSVNSPNPTLVYQWTLNTGGIIVSSSTAPTITVGWGAAAVTCTLTVNAVPKTGGAPVASGTHIVDVVAKPQPLIFTNYRVACQNFAADSTGNGSGRNIPDPPTPPTQDPDTLMADDKGCPKVCEGAYVTYTSSSIPAGHTVTWAVLGGTIISGQGTGTLVVEWGPAGPGLVTLYEYDGECMGEKTVCVTIIEKPIAQFSVLPNTTPPAPSDVTTVCLRTAVAFMNQSYSNPMSPIVSYYWNFGDGTISSQKNPPPHLYGAAGTYNMFLAVKNACGCTDTFWHTIDVLSNPGPRIRCPSVACEFSEVEYSTNAVCASYNWTVVGGTITSNTGNKIKVLWSSVGPEGFGYVTLQGTSCGGLCEEATTIKVPVVQQNPAITGNFTICTNTEAQFSIPLWPGTQYNWGIINTPLPSPIIGTRNDHKVSLKFTTPGTYTLHLVYQNRIALCGNDLQYTVTVVPQDSIVGDMDACKNNSNVHTYTLFNSNAADWVLRSPSGVFYYDWGTTSFNAIFDEVGLWSLTATGAVCPTTVGINVDELDIPVDSVQGKRVVCLNTVTPYTALNSLPNTIFNWTITSGAGTLSAPTGDNVSVTWTSLPATLVVKRQSTVFPYCESPDLVLNITEDIVNPNVTGEDSVCADTYHDYLSNYNGDGASYTWEIWPQTSGSVTAGTYKPDMTFLSDHFTAITPAKIIVQVQQCGLIVRDSMDITILPRAIPEIFAPDTVCSGDTVNFMATVGGDSYQWLFGDQQSRTMNVNTVQHVYYNGSGSTKLIRVEVEVSGWDDSTECPPEGKAIFLIAVKSGPKASIKALSPTFFPCGTPIVCSLKAIVAPPHGTLTYQWYSKGVYVDNPIGGATTDLFIAGGTGKFYCIVKDLSTGCTMATSWIEVTAGACGGSCVGTISYGVTSNSCGEVTVTGTAVSSTHTSPAWYAYNADPQFGSGSNVFTTKFYSAGNNFISYSMMVKQANGSFCEIEYDNTVTVPLVPYFKYDIGCGVGGYSVTLENTSSFMDFYSNTSSNANYLDSRWDIYTDAGLTTLVRTGFGNTWTVTPQLASGTYYIKLTSSLYNGSNNAWIQDCETVMMLYIPPWPVVTTSRTPSSTCELLPVDFTTTVTPSTYITSYMWDFGDGAFSALANTYREYKWDVNNPLVNPQQYDPEVTVTDKYGCEFKSKPGLIDVWRNDLDGYITGATSVCTGPVALTYNPNTGTATDYMWSNETVFGGTNPTNVATSGSYFVTVEDAHKCRKVTLPADVEIINLQATGISGNQDYCEGDPVILSAFSGAGGLLYQWKRNGSNVPMASGGNGPRIIELNLPAGTYNYDVELVLNTGSLSCTTTTATFTVVVHGAPSAPVITGPTVIDCTTYELQLSGSPAAGNLKWSNGAYGNINTIFAGGPYRLWYTDPYGCVSHSDTYVPESPESKFGWFPDGCYDICDKQMPFQLFGPPGKFPYWDWHDGGGTVYAAGTGTGMTPLTINSPNTYFMTLDNGLCAQTTNAMNITKVPCECPPVYVSSTFTCDPAIPGGYNVSLTINSPGPGAEFTIGLSNGPAVPYTIFVPGGLQTINFNVTMLMNPPVTLDLVYYMPGGAQKCYERIPVSPTYPCGSWPQERRTGNRDDEQPMDATGMLVFPNPAAADVTVNYHFTANSTARQVSVYDITGRRLARQVVSDIHGSYVFSAANWAPGVYIVRMEEDGRAIHSQRLTISH